MTEEVLLPSGSAALYRRAMLDEIGGFDDDFFLYCEDTDLGLRARWAGWKCLYVPGAVVEHHYSHSAGRASPLKAYYVERNRLFVLVKNFPAADAAARAVRDPGALLLALLWYCCEGRAAPPASARKETPGRRWCWYVASGPFRTAAPLGRSVAEAPRRSAPARASPPRFRQLLRATPSAPEGWRSC